MKNRNSNSMFMTTKSNMKGKIGIGLTTIFALTVLFTLVISDTSSAALTFQGRACSGNSICDVIRRCDASGCISSFENCQSCGTSTKVCPNGVATAPNTCSEVSGSPQCVTATPVCSTSQIQVTSDPPPILTFNVFTKKNLLINITPSIQAGLAGSTLNYKMSMENKNPQSLTFQISSQIPEGWTINIPGDVTIGANSAKEVQFRVTSPAAASDASYPIVIGVFNSQLNLFGTATAQYLISARGAPTISIDPRSQSGLPGQTLMYTVSVTNNDPEGFDATTITLRASSPSGFSAVFTPSSIKLQPGETGSVRLDVTSSVTASEPSYQVGINATANKMSSSDALEYIVNFCGNNVCDMGEQSSCSSDCPLDPNFICNGRCENELDDGLAFSANVNIPFDRFLVCNRNSSTGACLTSSCGVGRACICSSNQPDCSALCVDTRGAYYMLADQTKSIANYSFACPFVNLPEIVSLKNNFTKARQDYEKAQSALRESLKTNITAAKRSETQPCVDALSSIIIMSGDYVSYLNQVIAWPGKTNTTAARARAVAVRGDIETTYNTFCRGVTGLLQIDSINAQPAEKGGTARLSVTIKNIGNIVYNGFAQCELTGGQGEKVTVGGTCTAIGSQQLSTFQLSTNATSGGQWTARCLALASISDCTNSSIHDEKTAQFNVVTKDAFIIDVSGTCSDKVICSVRSSNPGCVTCESNNRPCTPTGTLNGVDTFECPRLLGNLTLTASVVPSASCIPVQPVQKSINILCVGCGDDKISGSEQCELPSTDDNAKCSQAKTTCNGKLFGVRDGFGACTAACGCSYDAYEYSCTVGQCGAQCNDLEARVVTINKTNGVCQCVQQCGPVCTWNTCDCEVSGTLIIPENIGASSVQINHNPSSGNTVTLTASATNSIKTEIVVDGFVVKTCQISPCVLTADYEAGLHTYFARASNGRTSITDPTEGSKAFTISGTATGNGTQIRLNTSTIILDIAHSPASPSVQDPVMLSAIAHGPRTFREINLFVDNTLRKTCTNYPSSQECTFRSSYTAGTHNYYATAVDVSNVSVRDPTSGTKSFVITGASSNGTGGIGGSGGGPPVNYTAGFGACYANIISKNCTYNPDTRRYDLSLTAEWENGTHVHWIVEDNTGPKMYIRNFSHTEPLAAPGVKTIKVAVHNANDSTLCLDTDQIYCGPGTTTGKDLDMIIDVKSVLKLGTNDLRILAVSYKDIPSARIQGLIDSGLTVSGVTVEGNTSLAGISGPIRVQENKSYSMYTATTNLVAGGNVSVHYRLNVTRAGEYTIIAIANYSGKTEKITKIIKATSCPQTYNVLAISNGVCKQFTTPCDVPAGWKEVNACPDVNAQPVQEDNTLLIVVVIIVIVVAGVLGYKYRDQIEERLGNIRKKKGHSGEEMPNFDN